MWSKAKSGLFQVDRVHLELERSFGFSLNFITSNFKRSLNKFSILFSYNSLKKFREKLDPRKYNGAIFLGLHGPVVKSHGATDAVGFAYSIEMCHKIVKANLIDKIKLQNSALHYFILH